MFDFIRAMLFGGTHLVTQAPLDLRESWMEIPVTTSLEVLNNGARLEIDVTSIIPPTQPGGHDAIERMRALEARFAKKCVEGRLVEKSGRETPVWNTSISVSSEQSFLILSGDNNELQTERSFNRLFLRSTCGLTSVKIYWRDSGK